MLEPVNGSLTVLPILVVVIVVIIIIVLSMPSCMAGMLVVVGVCIVLLAQVPQIGYLAVALVIPSHPGRNALPSMIVSLWCPVCSLWPWLQAPLPPDICLFAILFGLSLWGKAVFLLSRATENRLEENNSKESGKKQ